jgi:hypothetical protein
MVKKFDATIHFEKLRTSQQFHSANVYFQQLYVFAMNSRASPPSTNTTKKCRALFSCFPSLESCLAGEHTIVLLKLFFKKSITHDDVTASDVHLYGYNSRTVERIFIKFGINFMLLDATPNVTDAETCEVELRVTWYRFRKHIVELIPFGSRVRILSRDSF